MGCFIRRDAAAPRRTDCHTSDVGHLLRNDRIVMRRVETGRRGRRALQDKAGGCDLRQKKLAPRRSRANARRLCFRSFLLPFQIEPASLGFDLVFRENAIYMKTKMIVAGKVIGSQKKSACSYAGAKKCTFFFFHLKSKKASFIMPYVSIIHIY